MKRYNILKNLMIAIPAVIILLSFVIRIASVDQLWFITSLGTCFGAVAFRITDYKKPLDWILTGSVLTVLILVFELAGGNAFNWLGIAVFILSACELLLAIVYWVGRRMALLP